tara:strand:+ start:298 stop:618 length:321 start_codon:yes stop_codon:yes gene_type:complete
MKDTEERFILDNFINNIVDEIEEELTEYDHEYSYDIVREIVDSYIPIYNVQVVEFAHKLDGEDWAAVWLGEPPYEGESIIRQLQINLYELLLDKVCSHEKMRKLDY